MFKLLILITGMIGLIGGMCIQTSAQEETQPTEERTFCPGSTAAILYETKTNQILYDKEKDRRLPPASMTKIMTLLLIYEALDSKQITKDTKLTITEEPTKVEGSKAFLSIGDEITVDELLKCICIASANDAAIAMALHLAGSEAEFVKKMNDKVAALGLKNTHFNDCTGLSSKNHYTSAYDLAVIADELIDRYPDVLNYTNIKEDYIRKDTEKPFWLVNTNKMIGRVKYLDGLKTGYTSFSKYCITLHMKQDNMSLVSVVFGYEKPTTRNAESLELLRYGFATYKIDRVIEKGQMVQSINHLRYQNRINVATKEDLYYLCKKTEQNEYSLKYDYDIEYNRGSVIAYLNGTCIGQVPMEAEELPKKRSLWSLWIVVMKRCFS